MALLATQQPIAYDLRQLASSLDICTELERMGDYAKGIANNPHPLARFGPSTFPEGYLFHGRKSGGYASSGHDYLCQRGSEGARAIMQEDERLMSVIQVVQ